MKKTSKGVRLDHITKIYQDPKTKKEFAAVDDIMLNIKPNRCHRQIGQPHKSKEAGPCSVEVVSDGLGQSKLSAKQPADQILAAQPSDDEG